MKNLNKMLAMLLITLIVLPVLVSCSGSSKKEYKIGIITMVENGAFVDMKDGIIARLKEKGYTDDNTEYVYKCAGGDSTALSTISTSMDDGSYTLVFTIATPATQQFVNMESDTPCFFCAVSAPVAANVITDMSAPDKNATGTSNAIPVDDIFALADKLTPDIQKWGLIYCTGETNSTDTIKSCEAFLKAANIEYVTKTVSDSSQVKSVTESLLAEGVQAIFVPNDSVIQSGVTALAELCQEKGIPTYCSSATTVESGCMATVAIDDKGIGGKTADLALEYLSGKAVRDIPATVVAADYVSINKGVIESLKLTVPSDLGYEVQYLGK